MEDVSIAEMPFFTDSLYYYSETDPSQSGLYWHYENSNIEEFINWVGMTGTFEHFMAKIEVQPDEEGRPRGFIPFESTLTLEITEFDKQQGVSIFNTFSEELMEFENYCRELLQDDFVAVDPGFITFGLDIL